MEVVTGVTLSWQLALDHFLPLLYVIGTRQQGEVITFPIEGIEGGSISMLTIQVGKAKKFATRPEDQGVNPRA